MELFKSILPSLEKSQVGDGVLGPPDSAPLSTPKKDTSKASGEIQVEGEKKGGTKRRQLFPEPVVPPKRKQMGDIPKPFAPRKKRKVVVLYPEDPAKVSSSEGTYTAVEAPDDELKIRHVCSIYLAF
ncbi:MAG: hypothetical protein GY739_20090 [Mesoflavibacter sp.]|nr:hypothetical protein [Mesoflavibacter sp.]